MRRGLASVSYEPTLKPLVDKSPPTAVQEFGGLMKKSCCAGWEERSPRLRGLSERPIKAPTGAAGAGLVWRRRRRRWAETPYSCSVWEFTAAVYQEQVSNERLPLIQPCSRPAVRAEMCGRTRASSAAEDDRRSGTLARM